METIFIYILKVNIALAVFYLLYMLLFSKDTFIRLRRYYFLSAIIFSLAYPLFTVSALGSLIDLKPAPVATETSVYIGELSMGELIVDNVEEVAVPIDWAEVTKNILLVGIVFLSLRFIWQLLSILRIKTRSNKKSLFGYCFYHLKDEITPFSFFNWIFIHAETHSEKELKQILLHEHTHARQWHSLDILLVELLRISFWWNPVVWLMKRDMAINLEYLADQAVLQEGVETIEYQYHLLQLTNHETTVQIVNNFNVSQLKKRIIMMNTIKSPMRKLAKYLSILPLALLLITANSMYAQTNEMQESVKEIVPPPPPPPPPPPEKPVKSDKNKDITLEQGEKYPEMKKSIKEITDFIQSEMKYPQIAKENGIQGSVLASFTVEKDGSISNPKIEKGIDPSLDKEAIRVINAMPKTTPFTETENGEAIAVRYTLPFNFSLTGKDTSSDYSIIGFKAVANEDSNKVVVVGSGSMKDKPVETLAEKFGADKPLYFVDGEKTEDIDKIDPKDIESVSVLKNKSAISKYGDEGKNGVIEITTKAAIAKSALMDATKEKRGGKTEEIFVVVEDQPQFTGGTKALMQYLSNNIKYPKEAHEKKIEGRVIANFVINKDGSISDVSIVRGIDPLLDAEAIRVISEMPNWKPGMQRGEAVRVRFTLPIIFRLKADEETAKEKNGNNKEDKVFVVVEKQPEFPGGNTELMKFLATNIIYPEQAVKNKIEGRVIINFIVNKDGSLSNIEVVRGQDPLLDAEATRVIASMPNWKPGMLKGEPVDVRFTLPVVFSLKADEKAIKDPLDELKGRIKEVRVE